MLIFLGFTSKLLCLSLAWEFEVKGWPTNCFTNIQRLYLGLANTYFPLFLDSTKNIYLSWSWWFFCSRWVFPSAALRSLKVDLSHSYFETRVQNDDLKISELLLLGDQHYPFWECSDLPTIANFVTLRLMISADTTLPWDFLSECRKLAVRLYIFSSCWWMKQFWLCSSDSLFFIFFCIKVKILICHRL